MLAVQMQPKAFLHACEGHSPQTLMPLDSGRKLDGITGNWIVFYLLWKQTLPLRPSYLQSTSPTPRSPVSSAPLFPSHYGSMSHQTSAFTCHPKFPLA